MCSRGNKSVSGTVLRLRCRGWAKLRDLQEEDQPTSAPTSLSFLSAMLKEVHLGELVPGLLGAPLPFPFPLVGAISCLPETWKDGDLSPQLPPESLASPDANRTFFSQFSYVREGIQLTPHKSQTSPWVSLCLARGSKA